MVLKDPIKYPYIDEFFDLIENKYAIRIRPESNTIQMPHTISHLAISGASLASALHITHKRYVDAMFRTEVILGSPNPWASDLITVIKAIKQMGMYEETEGLPRKYQECLSKYNIQLKEYQELKKDFDVVSENYEKIKTEKKELQYQVNTLNLELDSIKRR